MNDERYQSPSGQSRPEPSASDHDAGVAARLRPLTDVPAPDLWAGISARAGVDHVTYESPADDTAAGYQHRRRRLSALAAVAVALVIVGGAWWLAGAGDQQVTTLDQPATSGMAGTATTVGSTVPGPADDEAGAEADTAADTGFPEGLAIGPELVDPIPVDLAGTLAVISPAGTVFIATDGSVIGHLLGPVPAWVGPVDYSDTGANADDAVPDGCRRSPAGPLICIGDTTLTVETTPADGVRRVLAATPDPPDSDLGLDIGEVAEVLVPDLAMRGRPMLLDAVDSCGGRRALLAERPLWATTRTDGDVIRNYDGTDFWSGPSIAGETKAVGWSVNGVGLAGLELYVWRYSARCGGVVDEPGVYAYPIGDGGATGGGATGTAGRRVVALDDGVIGVVMVSPGTDAVNPPRIDVPDDLADDAAIVADYLVGELQLPVDFTLTAVDDLDPGYFRAEFESMTVGVRPRFYFDESEPTTEELADWRADVWTIGPDGPVEVVATAWVDESTGAGVVEFTAPAYGSGFQWGLDPGDVEAIQRSFEDSSDSGSGLEEGDRRWVFDLDAKPTAWITFTARWFDDDGALRGVSVVPIAPGQFESSAD